MFLNFKFTFYKSNICIFKFITTTIMYFLYTILCQTSYIVLMCFKFQDRRSMSKIKLNPYCIFEFFFFFSYNYIFLPCAISLSCIFLHDVSKIPYQKKFKSSFQNLIQILLSDCLNFILKFYFFIIKLFLCKRQENFEHI
jgi:hypothetical protein